MGWIKNIITAVSVYSGLSGCIADEHRYENWSRKFCQRVLVSIQSRSQECRFENIAAQLSNISSIACESKNSRAHIFDLSDKTDELAKNTCYNTLKNAEKTVYANETDIFRMTALRNTPFCESSKFWCRDINALESIINKYKSSDNTPENSEK